MYHHQVLLSLAASLSLVRDVVGRTQCVHAAQQRTTAFRWCFQTNQFIYPSQKFCREFELNLKYGEAHRRKIDIVVFSWFRSMKPPIFAVSGEAASIISRTIRRLFFFFFFFCTPAAGPFPAFFGGGTFFVASTYVATYHVKANTTYVAKSSATNMAMYLFTKISSIQIRPNHISNSTLVQWDPTSHEKKIATLPHYAYKKKSPTRPLVGTLPLSYLLGPSKLRKFSTGASPYTADHNICIPQIPLRRGWVACIPGGDPMLPLLI